VVIELATIAVGAVLLYIIPFPFLTMPIGASLFISNYPRTAEDIHNPQRSR
jgi:hypothetical protein